ncbi:MAG: hypothetical protein C1941_06075 [Prosthecochloris sp.]|nr:hypothetical protein [Prosthecochloris sp.]
MFSKSYLFVEKTKRIFRSIVFSSTNHQSPITNHQSPITNHQSPITNHQSPNASVTGYSRFYQAG